MCSEKVRLAEKMEVGTSRLIYELSYFELLGKDGMLTYGANGHQNNMR
jgi:hypothetical protein